MTYFIISKSNLIFNGQSFTKLFSILSNIVAMLITLLLTLLDKIWSIINFFRNRFLDSFALITVKCYSIFCFHVAFSKGDRNLHHSTKI